MQNLAQGVESVEDGGAGERGVPASVVRREEELEAGGELRKGRESALIEVVTIEEAGNSPYQVLEPFVPGGTFGVAG